MIQEKRGMLKVWNVLLVILAFLLALFGTFLTRSGVISSIHSFTQSPLGSWFLGFICLITAGSIALVISRLPLLRSKTRMESLVSREAAFLYNNLLLVALCLTILWGVVFPLLSEAVHGEQVTVSGPYYNFFLRIFGVPLLLLMAIGPLVAWRRASLRSLGRSFAWPAGLAVLVGIVLLILGAGSSWIGLVAYTFSAFVLASIGYEFVRGTRARRALTGKPWVASFAELVGRNRRRYGGYIVHAAIVLLAIGIVGSSAYDTTRERTLAPGQTMAISHYTVKYDRLVKRNGPNANEFRAILDVKKNGSSLGTLASGKNVYRAEQQTSNEVGIRSDPLTGEDLYVITDQINPNGTIAFKILVKPLVNLIWFAGVIFLIGSIVVLWPSAAEQRRLALRYRELRAPAHA
jgi:cytochrome c-type biogenesis protein CcmF